MAANEEKSPRADNDGGWKHILSAHLKDFVEFFWSEAYQAIDWTRPYELLEQELMAIGVNEEIGKRYVDKLFKVHLLWSAPHNKNYVNYSIMHSFSGYLR